MIEKYINSPGKLCLFFVHVCLLFCLPYSLPFFLISFIGYGFGRLFGLSGAKMLAAGLCIWLGIFVPLAHLFAQASLYGYVPLILILIFSAAGAIYGISRKQNPDEAPRYSFKDTALTVFPVCIVIFCLFLERDYYWDELHYHNYRANIALYAAKTKEKLIELLKKRNIRVFIATGTGFYAKEGKINHLLPKLLGEKDDALEFDGPIAYLK